MPSASETATVGTRNDGAIICKHSLPRGRCNKLIATEKGEVRCPNGHLVPLSDVLVQVLNKPDASWDMLCQGSPNSFEIRPLIRRLASPEFLQAKSESWQYNFLTYRSDVFTKILKQADLVEPECAQALRDYWERKLPEFWPEVAHYLTLLKGKDETEYFRFRERALLAFKRWSPCDPLRYLAWSELALETAKAQNDKNAVLYEHNIAETARLFEERKRFPNPALVYLDHCGQYENAKGTKRFYVFVVTPDPYWTFPEWNDFAQIHMKLRENEAARRSVCIDVSTNAGGNVRANITKELSELAKRDSNRSEESDGLIRYQDARRDKINAILPVGMVADLDDPSFHLKMVRDLVSALHLRMGNLVHQE